jgi:hypothetical protein
MAFTNSEKIPPDLAFIRGIVKITVLTGGSSEERTSPSPARCRSWRGCASGDIRSQWWTP